MQGSVVYKFLPTVIFRGTWFRKIPFYKNAVGVTIGNVIIIDDEMPTGYGVIVAHEKVHVEQFYRYLGFNGFMYLTSWGRMKLELEAYCRTYPSSRSKKYIIATTLNRHYRLKYSYTEILKATEKAMDMYDDETKIL